VKLSRLSAILEAYGADPERWPAQEREAALEGLADDIRDLEELTGQSYADWLGPSGGGDFSRRRLPEQRSGVSRDA